MYSLLFLFASCIVAHVFGQATHAAYRLRVEYLENPISIDVVNPRFSYALQHPTRAQVQTAYHIVVKTLAGTTVWDTGLVNSNQTLNIPYAGTPLVSDTDYTWTITWNDATGSSSIPTTGTFSTALFTVAAWQGAEWINSPPNGTLNTYRAEFNVPALPIRARLYISGLGYHKSWLNGELVDNHELGQFVTFQQRVLYDVIDITSQIQVGCNALGIMLGHGWFSQPSVKAGDRQMRLLLSMTAADNSVTYLASMVNSGTNAITFTATKGPVVDDDIYIGETFDGTIAASLEGWNKCGFSPVPGTWVNAVAPAITPTTFGSLINSHNLPITTDKSFTVLEITQPLAGYYVFDFGQNMAGQTELFVQDCPPGTNITILHAEILHTDGTIFNNYLPDAPMTGQYICGGQASETYRTLFTYYGFRYAAILGYPGVPDESSLVAHFVHSNFEQTGEFLSSDDGLNSIQHATRYASWSNLMDIPTDCPQRERRGWLGDAQLSFETVIHNIDGGAFYTKWLRDFIDTQVYDNATIGTNGALPDCIPYYGHGHESADAGWGIAAWIITDYFSDYYADDVFDVEWYPHLKWYMENWITIANKNAGLFNLFFWGDWANCKKFIEF
jgi:alpha-L-rhamnosidase